MGLICGRQRPVPRKLPTLFFRKIRTCGSVPSCEKCRSDELAGSGGAGGFGEHRFATTFEKTLHETLNALISKELAESLRVGGGGSAGAENLESTQNAFFAS